MNITCVADGGRASASGVPGTTGDTVPMVATAVFAALILLAGFSHELGLRGAVALAAVSILWFLVNGPMEGRVLLVVTEGNGLTCADVGGLCALGIAAWRGRAAWRARAARST